MDVNIIRKFTSFSAMYFLTVSLVFLTQLFSEATDLSCERYMENICNTFFIPFIP